MTREEIEALVARLAGRALAVRRIGSPSKRSVKLREHDAALDDAAAAAISQTLARIAELEAALLPFAAAAVHYANGRPDRWIVWGDVTFGHLRRARAALSATTGAASEGEQPETIEARVESARRAIAAQPRWMQEAMKRYFAEGPAHD